MKVIALCECGYGYNFRYFLLTEGKEGYVVITCNGELDFDQCMCCCSARDTVGEAIKANRGGLSKVTMCGTYSKYNTELGVDATFDELTSDEKEAIKVKITALKAEIDRTMEAEETRKNNIVAVCKLIRELRYEDARMHCVVCGLNYEEFLEEARKVHGS